MQTMTNMLAVYIFERLLYEIDRSTTCENYCVASQI